MCVTWCVLNLFRHLLKHVFFLFSIFKHTRMHSTRAFNFIWNSYRFDKIWKKERKNVLFNSFKHLALSLSLLTFWTVYFVYDLVIGWTSIEIECKKNFSIIYFIYVLKYIVFFFTKINSNCYFCELKKFLSFCLLSTVWLSSKSFQNGFLSSSDDHNNKQICR